MSCFIKNIKKDIYAKRKQILFALFAVLYSILDKSNSQDVIKAAAPAVVAAAAKGATAVAKTAKTVDSTAKTVKGAQNIAKAKNSMGTLNQAKKTSDSLGSINKLNSNMPKNTNPKGNTIPQNKNFNYGVGGTTTSLGVNSSSSENKELSTSDNSEEKNTRSNYLMPPFVPTKMPEEADESEPLMDDASSEVVKSAPAMLGLMAFGSLFLFVMLVPLMILGVVNASSSTLSQIDCTKHQGSHCKVEEESGIESFFSKLKNLFVYGAYGSNSEVVLKKIEKSYDDIKEEYDFIISLPLLTSSLFSDAEYVDTDSENNKIVITEKMLERSKYIYDMAMLQLIPKFNVYTCNAVLVDEFFDIYEYEPSYEYSKIPTYEPDDTTEADMELIPTGECDASTAGSQYKKIQYFFDETLYFKRLKISDELDLVYADFVEADKLLVSKVQTQYYLYKHLYNVDEELGYMDVPQELEYDPNINLQSPLKGWYSITSPFGNREGEFAGMHTGIDLVSSNKNIYAAGSGVVTRSNVETEGGNVIEITHTDKFGKEYVTQYAHLSERNVNVGDTINAGDVIGIMGDTGTMANGVHLHFSMWDKDTNDLYNPRKLFNDASNY